MLYIVMHKVDAKMEAGALPDKTLISQMGQLMGGLVQSGKLQSGAGLRPSATRVRVQCRGGQCTTTQGPLQGGNELITGFTMLKVKNMDEAVTWTKRMAEALGDCEVDVGPV